MLSWAWRHKRAIAIGSLTAATAYGAYVIYRKKRELEDLLESVGLSELLNGGGGGGAGGRHSREVRVREHFAETQKAADRLMLEALPRMSEAVGTLLDTDALREQMKKQRQMSNMERWHEMMVLVVSRVLTAQYAVALYVLQLRTKLNIVSRHYLLEVIETRAADSTQTLSNLTKRRFLSADHFLGEGLQALAADVTACVRAHLTEQLDATRLAEMLTAEQAFALMLPVRAELEAGLEGAKPGTPRNAKLSSGSSSGGKENGHANGASAKGDHTGLLGRFLLSELRASLGTVAEGDQLYLLLDEATEVLRSAEYRLTLCDVLASSRGALLTELNLQMSSVGGGGLAAAAAEEGGDAPPPSKRLQFAKLLPQLHNLAVNTLKKPEPVADAVVATAALDEFCWMAYSGE